MTSIAPRTATVAASGTRVRTALAVSGSLLAGALLAALWSYEFVDSTIGDTVADGLLGYSAKQAPIGGVLQGAAFAFVTGLAGTFTACNIAVMSAVPPLLQQRGAGGRVVAVLRPLGWFAAGALAVAMIYGAIGALIGTRLPQLSEAVIGNGLPVRLLQSMVVFGLLGLVFIWLGLAALGVVPDPLERATRRHPAARMLFLGALVGAFLIGRPFPLFHKLFQHAAETGNAAYGAAAFGLQALGNIAVMAVLFVLLATRPGARLQRWMAEQPARTAVVLGSALIVAGSFTFLYWDVRLPSMFGYGWYPVVDWS